MVCLIVKVDRSGNKFAMRQRKGMYGIMKTLERTLVNNLAIGIIVNILNNALRE